MIHFPESPTNIRLTSLVSYTLWLLKLVPESAQSQLLPLIFTLKEIPSCTFPDSSLALTSALGNIFLPISVCSSNTLSTNNFSSLPETGGFCLFYASILKTDPHLLSVLERVSNHTNLLMHFLFLHSTLAKDKLALPTSNNLWSNDSGVGEVEFMEFQTACPDLLKMGRLSE